MKTTYQIDPAHSSAEFVVRHMMITNVRGAFSKVKGTVVWDPENPSATDLDAVIDVNSIHTRDEQRDAHLRSADFFDAEKYPNITFQGTKAEPAGDGEVNITGNLTIRGVTKPVTLHVEGPSGETKDPFGNVRIGAAAKTKIKRGEFGLNRNAALETGGFLVGDEVKIELEISLIRAEAAKAA